MIGTIDTISGSPCYLCGEPIEGGWYLHEITRDQWEVVCNPCDLIAGLSEGK